ncbi:MAG: glycoside hydrolase [Myxococcales bacterium]|nr:glycoside hydrolase [Myxococcales bacterium]
MRATLRACLCIAVLLTPASVVVVVPATLTQPTVPAMVTQPTAAATVAARARFEVAFDLLPPAPADPDAVDIDAAFTAPSGAVTHVGGFFDGRRFRVRFAAPSPGRWTYRVRAAGAEVARGSVEVTPAHDRGYVRRDPRASHRLAFDDGTPFYPLGENRFNVYDPRWNYQEQSIEAYLAAMQRGGMNTLRLFVIVDCEDEEGTADHVQLGCLETSPGRFSPAVAARYDRIVDAAEQSGIYVIFGVWAIGFTPAPDTWKSWDDNPYSRARGGPLARPTDFFTRVDLRPLEARKLAYIAHRWGYSTHLLAVDLLNEPEWDGPIPEPVWIPWADDMAARWRAVDRYRHLVTAGSVGLHWNLGGDERAWYASARNDLVQWHLYGKEYYEVHALAAMMAKKSAETWRYDKPILCGEFGYGGEDKPLFDHTHVGLWSAAFSGAGVLMHSAPPFNLDSDEPMTPERARHPSGLMQFLTRLSPAAHQPASLPMTPEGSRAFALRARDELALWLLAPERGYGQPLAGARVRLDELAPGDYRVRFVGELDGRVLSERSFTVAAGATAWLAVPPFTRHAAALITGIQRR